MRKFSPPWGIDTLGLPFSAATINIDLFILYKRHIETKTGRNLIRGIANEVFEERHSAEYLELLYSAKKEAIREKLREHLEPEYKFISPSHTADPAFIRLAGL